MSKNLNQDQFDAVIVGNLVSDPNLIEDEDGNKICFCRVATNPRAKKFDPKTGRELTPEERNKRRSFVELRLKSGAAERFAELFVEGDRVRLEGEIGTRRIEKGFWSKKEGRFVSVNIDVDDDGKNVQDVYEGLLLMWVHHFSKIVGQDTAMLSRA
jgi:single-stranded DNA-binding protein